MSDPNPSVALSSSKGAISFTRRSLLVGGVAAGSLAALGISARPAAAAAVTFTQTSRGNIFPAGTARTIRVNATDASVSWTAKNLDGTVVADGSLTPSGGGATLTLPSGLANGWYQVTATGSAGAVANTTAAMVAAPLSIGVTAGSQFGVCTHYGLGRNVESQSLILPSGVGQVREDVRWNNIETTPGVYNWSSAHTFLDPLFARGIRPVLIACYTNDLYDGGAKPQSTTAKNAYANYCKALVQEFGADISAIEIWNEWTHGSAPNDPQTYVNLLAVAAPAIRSVNATIPILGPASSNPRDGWIETCFELGALDHVSGVIMHPYNWPNSADEMGQWMADLKQLIRDHNGGADKPLWVTETGWPTGTQSGAVSEREQARNTAKILALATANSVKKLFTYILVDDGTNTALREDSFGLVRHGSSSNGAYTPKIAFAAHATGTRILTNATAPSRITGVSATTIYKFTHRDGGPLQVAWASSNRTLIWTASGTPVATTMTGRVIPTTVTGGEVSVDVGPDPVYVQGVTGTPQIA